LNTRRVHLAVTLVISAALCLRQVYAFYRTRGKDMATAGTACYLGGGYFLTAKHVAFLSECSAKAAPCGSMHWTTQSPPGTSTGPSRGPKATRLRIVGCPDHDCSVNTAFRDGPGLPLTRSTATR